MSNEGKATGSLSEQNKIVHVRGVRFDISSILNDVTTSIQNNIQKSLDGALKDYELYKSTHDAILQIPFVRELYIQNQELISQLEMLEQPISQSQSQPIQLKIDELSPQSSPVVMHSYFQFDPNCDNGVTKNTNKKLSSTSESEEEEEEVASEAEEEEEEEEAEQEEEEEAEQEEEEEVEAEEEEAEEEEVEAEEEEVEAEEEEKEAEEEEEKEQEEEDEEEEVYEVVIKNVTYFTTNEDTGDIYSCVDGDVGEIVGKFKNKKPVFMKRK
jgi:hypothetical protein